MSYVTYDNRNLSKDELIVLFENKGALVIVADHPTRIECFWTESPTPDLFDAKIYVDLEKRKIGLFRNVAFADGELWSWQVDLEGVTSLLHGPDKASRPVTLEGGSLKGEKHTSQGLLALDRPSGYISFRGAEAGDKGVIRIPLRDVEETLKRYVL